MTRYRVREEMNGISEAPGKVWFWELEAGVIDAGRCIRCGTCVAVCPSNSIGVSGITSLPELVKMCTGCSLCWDFCPRGGLRYEAVVAPSVAESPWKITGAPAVGGCGSAADGGGCGSAADGGGCGSASGGGGCGSASGGGGCGSASGGLGPVVERYAVRSATGRPGVQDGGAVTAMLVAWLAAGEIDGALVAVPGPEPWRGVATIATTPEEVAASAGSFYNQTMALAELDLSGYDLPDRPRLALVGTPCEIQGVRAMQSRRWTTGAHRVEAVVLTVALLCTKSFDYEALMLRELRDRRRIDLDRVARVDVVRGRMVVEYRDGEVAVDEPVKAFHGAALKGCDECADFLGRSADLSVGSVGSLDGWTSVLVRTERGRAALGTARRALDVRDLDDPEALVRLDQLDKRTAIKSLARKFDPDAPLFIDFEEHVRTYRETDRRPVEVRR